MTHTDVNLENDVDLLAHIMEGQASCAPMYQPGPYWAHKAKAAAGELHEQGLANFRSADSSVANSFGDNPMVDISKAYSEGSKRRLAQWLFKLPVVGNVLNAQRNIAQTHFHRSTELSTLILNRDPRVKELLDRYNVPQSNMLGCAASSGSIHGSEISHHYLELLNTLDHVNTHIDLNTKRSLFEIGGGFGVNLHLMIENFPNLRKFIYLDIAPNLYVGTQYLKAVYGDAVQDFRATQSRGSLTFADDDSLEILCILPHQIEHIASSTDVFYNAHSFVEMPEAVVQNYANHAKRVLAPQGDIALVSYGHFDLNSTFDPAKLGPIFDLPFEAKQVDGLLGARNHYQFHRSKDGV